MFFLIGHCCTLLCSKLHKSLLAGSGSQAGIIVINIKTAASILACESHHRVCMMTSSNGNISVLLVLCDGNPPVTGGSPSQMSVTRSFDAFFDLRLNKGW